MKRPFGHRGVSKLTVFVNVIFLAMTFVSCGARNDTISASGAVWDEFIRYDIGPLDESVDSMPDGETENTSVKDSLASEPITSAPRETTESPPETSFPETSFPETSAETETTRPPETTCPPAVETSAPAAESLSETAASSVDAHNETATAVEKENRETAAETTSEVRDDKVSRTVYWVKSGKVWHTTKDCPSLSRSKSILSGSVDDAMAVGKERVCKRCGR